MKLKTITVPRGYDGLHIEFDGGVVNIQTALTDEQGQAVTRVSVDANGDRYAGEPEWWCPDLALYFGPEYRAGMAIRIVQGAAT